MVEHDDEIKVLGEINLDLQSGPHKLIEKLSQEKVSQEEALEQFKSMVKRDDEIKVVVVQNNVQQEIAGDVVFYPSVHEDVIEEVIEIANDQAEALSD
ncbi:hypothetical protein Tco_0626452 [Tanacetum coccineum]|uniref:Uncharacterized protein n=1 Tax=Tanacetum coccineum TaxID=301880 RepID=A0ABQ4WJM5_9ASTR